MGCRSRSRICSTRSTCRPATARRSMPSHRPAADAACVALARAAGAIVVGKTVTTEFATFHPGPTCNPRNPTHTPGGSSSGSAAAVADRMVPLAFGTQTAGSIVRPAAYCGVVGYKPTYGTINRVGVKMISDTLDTVGVLARTVPDAALFVAALSDRRELLIEQPQAGCAAGAASAGPTSGTGRALKRCAVFEDAARRLREAGASVRDIALPPPFAGLVDAQHRDHGARGRAIAVARMARAPRQSEPRDDRHDRSRSCGIARSATTPRGRLARSCRAALANVFEDIDVVLAPSTVGEAPEGIRGDRRSAVQPDVDAAAHAVRPSAAGTGAARIAGRRHDRRPDRSGSSRRCWPRTGSTRRLGQALPQVD